MKRPLRSCVVLSCFILTAILCLSLGVPHRATAQAKGEFEWRVQLAADKVAPSNVTATNDCKRNHSFHIEPERLPFMRLLGDASFMVAPGQDHVVPVEFDTRNMKSGQYEALISVKCVDCKADVTCHQDHTNLHVFLTVTPAAPNWSAIHPEQKGDTTQNPALRWTNISPERKPH